jgi:solute carrier family 25 protein 14/30
MQARTTGEGMNMVSICLDIMRREGVGGLWRGLCPTAHRSAVVAAVQLPMYDATKEQLLSHNLLCEGSLCHLVSSIVAGISAAAASNPVDVIRTRMMDQRKLKEQKGRVEFYRSSLECGMHIVRREGAMALYKGFVPAFSRMGPWNIVFFLVYEKLKLINK